LLNIERPFCWRRTAAEIETKSPGGLTLNSIRRCKQFCRKARADAGGSAAVEFAFIAPVFFALLLAIFEAGLVFFAQFTLQNAVNDAARQIRTGQMQGNSGASKAAFRTLICNGISPLMACDTKLLVDVESFSGYGGVNYQDPLQGPNGKLNAGLNNYDVGSACSVVLVRAFYTWPVWAPGMAWFLYNMTDASGNKAHLISSAAAFRNEPYANQTC
jgi:Flp pilus assembly protein TadG